MNLFVGVIFDEFMKQSDKYNEKFKYLNEKQIQWIEMQPLIQKAKPEFNAIQPPTQPWRFKIYNLVRAW